MTFTPIKYEETWNRVEFESKYKQLYKEYTKLTAQLEGVKRPFGRERTIHNLANTRMKLEHRLRILNKLCLAEQADHKTAAELRTELEHTKRLLSDSEATLAMIIDQKSEVPANSAPSLFMQVVELKNRVGELQCEVTNLEEDKEALQMQLDEKDDALNQKKDELELFGLFD
jgi:chromosome segregation ATPase